MASLNRVTLIGNLGRNPEVRTTPNGTKVATVSLATTTRWRDTESKEAHARPEWHRVVLWGRNAEIVGEHCTKGSQLYVEGPIQTRSWTDRDGTKRYTTEVVARRVQLLGRAEDRRVPEVKEPAPEAPTPNEPEVPEDDIPF